MKTHFLLSVSEISGEYFVIFASWPRDHKLTETFSSYLDLTCLSNAITLMAFGFFFALKCEYGFTFSCWLSLVETSSLANFPLQTLQVLNVTGVSELHCKQILMCSASCLCFTSTSMQSNNSLPSPFCDFKITHPLF